MTFFFANIHMQFRIQGHIAKDVYSNSSPYWSLQTQGLCSPWSAGLEDLTVLLGLFSRSHALSLYLTFLIFLPHLPRSLHPFLILIFASKLRLWGVGKWAEQSMWGFEDHLELGDSLCGAASWTYKEMGAGEIEKGGALQSSGCLVWNCKGDGVCSSLVDLAFRCTQAELLACRSHPQPSQPSQWYGYRHHPTQLSKHWKGFRGKLVHLSQKNAIQFMWNQADGNVCHPFRKFGK